MDFPHYFQKANASVISIQEFQKADSTYQPENESASAETTTD